MEKNKTPTTGQRDSGRAASPTASTFSTTMFTPATSEADSTTAPVDARFAIPAGPLQVTALSTTEWQGGYPQIGQFVIKSNNEVYAATPEGLIHFKRVHDHPSKPWTRYSRIYPNEYSVSEVRLDSATVTGLACLDEGRHRFSHLFCVADGKLYAFAAGEAPLALDGLSDGLKVSGTPAIAAATYTGEKDAWGDVTRHPGRLTCVVIPRQSGGLLFNGIYEFGDADQHHSKTTYSWGPAGQIATHLGDISAVSVAVHAAKVLSTGHQSSGGLREYSVFLAVVASGRVHVEEGQLYVQNRRLDKTLYNQSSYRIQHPGEVTGNPVILCSRMKDPLYRRDVQLYQLDLFVPSAEGGIFHFIQTEQTGKQWYMVGRVIFPLGVPMASCLSVSRHSSDSPGRNVEFRAHVQCGGRLYMVKTTEGPSPWVGSVLYPIHNPGPFPY